MSHFHCICMYYHEGYFFILVLAFCFILQNNVYLKLPKVLKKLIIKHIIAFEILFSSTLIFRFYSSAVNKDFTKLLFFGESQIFLIKIICTNYTVPTMKSFAKTYKSG